MTPAEKVQKIKEIYDRAMADLEVLGKERKSIVRGYIKELEAQKISAIRESILADSKGE